VQVRTCFATLTCYILTQAYEHISRTKVTKHEEKSIENVLYVKGKFERLIPFAVVNCDIFQSIEE